MTTTRDKARDLMIGNPDPDYQRGVAAMFCAVVHVDRDPDEVVQELTRLDVKDLSRHQLEAIVTDLVASTNNGHTLTHSTPSMRLVDGAGTSPPRWVSLTPIRHLLNR